MKIVAMALTCFLLLSMASCSSEARVSRGAGDGGPEVNPPGVLPITDETLTLTGFIPSVGLIEDISTNASMRRLTERTNIEFRWTVSSKIDARNKLRVLLVGGEVPDIIQGTNGSGLSIQDIARYGAQGLFIPLNELIEEYGVNIKEMFEALPGVREAITSADGNIYSLPAVFTDDYHMTMRQKLWINQTWLDNLGLSMPETTEEFFEVMLAFRDRDANGNGDPDDEIPMTGAKRSQEDLAMWLMNAFIPAGGPDDSGDAQLNNYEFIVEGQVFFSADKPEFREGLRYIRRLYTERLIHVAAFTQDRDQISPLVEGGSAARVGAVASHHPGNFARLEDDPEARFRQYAALPPIRGPAGHASTAWLLDARIEQGQFVITSAARHPQAAIRLADYYFSLEFAENEKGREGVHWRRVSPEEGLVAINGGPARYEYLETLTTEDNAQINMGPAWTRDLKNEFARTGNYSYEEMLYDATIAYEPFKIARYPYATVHIDGEATDEFDHLRRTIHTFVGESVDRFIIGDLDLETQWDEYVRQLNRIGLPRYLEILRRAYANP